MIAATSVLQQQAADIRSKTINWASYMQSQMISQEDYHCITALDKSKAGYLQSNPSQAVKTLLNLLSHVSKDSTIQYILVMIDDLLQEDRSRVDFFHEYCSKHKECVWGPFLNLLNRQDGFIVNMSSRILAKMACWGHEMMPKSDLNFYLQFLKDQLTVHVSWIFYFFIWSTFLIIYLVSANIIYKFSYTTSFVSLICVIFCLLLLFFSWYAFIHSFLYISKFLIHVHLFFCSLISIII